MPVDNWWRPDAAFLGGRTRDQLGAIAVECGASVTMARLSDYQKSGLVTALAAHFGRTAEADNGAPDWQLKGRDWLPDAMRFGAEPDAGFAGDGGELFGLVVSAALVGNVDGLPGQHQDAGQIAVRAALRVQVAGDDCAVHRAVLRQGISSIAYLRDILERMVNGHPASRLGKLLPWNRTPAVNS